MGQFTDKFKNQRQKLGISLRDAAKDTKIKLKYLKAIEKGEFNKIEREVFLKGFLKIYSDYLGLDKEQMLVEYKEYKKELTDEEINDQNNDSKVTDGLKNYADKNQNKLLFGFIVLLSITLIMGTIYVGSKLVSNFNLQAIQKIETLIVSLSSNFKEKSKSNSKSKDNKQASQNANTTSQQQNNVSSNKSSIPNLNEKEEISLKVKTIEKSWYSVTVDGQQVFAGTVQANQQQFFSGQHIKFKIGNAAGIRIIADDKIYGPFGDEGEVITKVFAVSKAENE